MKIIIKSSNLFPIMKLNWNCSKEEKHGDGPGSCSDNSNESINDYDQLKSNLASKFNIFPANSRLDSRGARKSDVAGVLKQSYNNNNKSKMQTIDAVYKELIRKDLGYSNIRTDVLNELTQMTNEHFIKVVNDFSEKKIITTEAVAEALNSGNFLHESNKDNYKNKLIIRSSEIPKPNIDLLRTEALNNINSAEKDSIIEYTKNSSELFKPNDDGTLAHPFTKINEALRGKMDSNDPDYPIAIRLGNNIISYLNKQELPQELVVYRGIKSQESYEISKLYGTDPNVILESDSIASASLSKEKAQIAYGTRDLEDPFHIPTVIEIRLPKGAHAALIDQWSSHSGEEEVLLNKGQKFKSLGSYGGRGSKVIVWEAII